MTIYVDQMFVENFIMNYIILYITVKFCNIDYRWYKLSIGASVGALYVILSYIFMIYTATNIILKIILSIFIVGISFTPKNKMVFFRLLACFYIITFFIGGVSFGLAYFFNWAIVKEGGVIYVEEFPIIAIALGSVISYILVKYVYAFMKEKKKLNNFLYSVKIKIFGNVVNTVMLYDSGHNVCEPFTGYPVIIVEQEILEKVVPRGILQNIKLDSCNFDEKIKNRIRIIPISTVNSEKEMKIGLKADEVMISFDGDEILIENAIIVGCNRTLSKDNSYYGLIGLNTIENIDILQKKE